MSESFFEKTHCDRCGKPLQSIRTMSWFTEETLCSICDIQEMWYKKKMRDNRMNPDSYEGCGFIPAIPT